MSGRDRARRRRDTLVRVGAVLVAALAGAGLCWSVGGLVREDVPMRIACGDALETSAEDDGCVLVPLWAVED